MRFSVQRRLTLRIAALALGVGLLGAAIQFVLTLHEMRRFQDNMLRQMAARALSHPERTPTSATRVTLGNSDEGIQVAVLPLDPTPSWFTPGLGNGLHSVQAPSGRLRVDVQRSGGLTAIAVQSTDARDDVAEDGGWHALIPPLLLIPLLVLAIHGIVRGAFAPVVGAARKLAATPAIEVSGLDIGAVPDELRPFTRAIDDLLKRTRQLVDQQQRFIADAAHELRSALTALALQADNLGHARDADDLRRRLAPLVCGIARARKLSEQLLQLARLGADAVALEPVEIGSLARSLLGDYQATARARDIDLGLDMPDEDLLIESSPWLLRAILGNAIDNAVKYTHPGGAVTLRVEPGPAAIRFEVEDSGPGIPADARAAVFTPFHRLHDHGGIEGSGLGLAIALEAATRLGATLSLHDRAGASGLVLRLTLPRASGVPTDASLV